MEIVTYLGLVAGILTTISFIPQLLQIMKQKRTKDISLPMYVIFCLGILLWLIYGMLKEDVAIIVANTITLFFACTILYFKMKHG